MVASDNFY